MPNILQSFSLEAKTILITGATGGICSGVSAAHAEAGADIVSLELPNDPQSHELRRKVEATGRKLTVFECDMKDDKSIKDAFEAIWGVGIVPDILVNGAGITNIQPIEDTSVARLDAVCFVLAHMR